MNEKTQPSLKTTQTNKEDEQKDSPEEVVHLLSLRRIEGKGALKGFADIRVFGMFYIHNCPIYKGSNGWFAAPPRMKGNDGVWREIIEFADDDFKRTFQSVVLQGYEDSVSESSLEVTFNEQ